MIARNGSTVIFINQLRMKIGVMFGNPETTTGGNALKFYSSVRLDIRRIGAIKDGDMVVGNRTRVKVVKNKMAPPFREAEFDVLYGQGVSKMHELLDLGAERGLVEKSGAWGFGASAASGWGQAARKRRRRCGQIPSWRRFAIVEKSSARPSMILNHAADAADPRGGTQGNEAAGMQFAAGGGLRSACSS